MGEESSSTPALACSKLVPDLSWLTACPDLAAIRDAAWLEAAELAQRHILRAGRRVFSDHELNHSFLIVLNGRIQIYKSERGRELTLYRLKAGDVCLFNVVSQLFGNPFHRVTAITETQVELASVPPEYFERAFLNSSEFRRYIVASLVRRLSDMMQLLEGIVFQRLDVRLAQLLILRACDSEDCVCITHSDIAKELGSSREVISRLLKEFEHKGWISLARGEIHIQRFADLHDFLQCRLPLSNSLK